MSKCDFCNKEATFYGSYQCYLVCNDHTKQGEEVENRMWESIESNGKGGFNE